MTISMAMNAATRSPNPRPPRQEPPPVPAYSGVWYVLRLIQLLLAIICLSLAGYASANWANSNSAGLTMFTVRIT